MGWGINWGVQNWMSSFNSKFEIGFQDEMVKGGLHAFSDASVEFYGASVQTSV